MGHPEDYRRRRWAAGFGGGRHSRRIEAGTSIGGYGGNGGEQHRGHPDADRRVTGVESHANSNGRGRSVPRCRPSAYLQAPLEWEA